MQAIRAFQKLTLLIYCFPLFLSLFFSPLNSRLSESIISANNYKLTLQISMSSQDSDTDAFRDTQYEEPDVIQTPNPHSPSQPFIKITINDKTEQIASFYDKNTFSYDIMFIQVREHTKQFQPSRYDDTINVSNINNSNLNGTRNKSWYSISKGNNSEMSGMSETEKKDGFMPEDRLQSVQEQAQQKILDAIQLSQEENSQRNQERPSIENQNHQQPIQVFQVGQLEIDDNVFELSHISCQEIFESKIDMSNEDFNEKMNSILQEKEDEEEKVDDELIEKRIQELEQQQMQRLIIKFKYENCCKITIKYITHELTQKSLKPKKIKSNYLSLLSRKMNLTKQKSSSEMWELGQSKIPIQIICIQIGCYGCRKVNLAYSRDNYFTTICQNSECMKNMQVEIIESQPRKGID